jgi:hypothetical protein
MLRFFVSTVHKIHEDWKNKHWHLLKIQGEEGHVQGAGGLILQFREKEDMYKALVD